MTAKKITRNGTGRMDILSGILESHILPSNIPARQDSSPVIRSPPYGQIIDHHCGDNISFSMINMPDGKFKSRTNSGFYVMALANDPISVFWRSRNGEGELRNQHGIILPHCIYYEISVHGSSCLNLLQIRRKENSKDSAESPSPLSNEEARKTFAGMLTLECHSGGNTAKAANPEEQDLLPMDFYLHRKAHTVYLGPAAMGIFYAAEGSGLEFAKVPSYGAILVKPGIPHYPLLGSSAQSFIITTPPSSDGKEIILPNCTIQQELILQLRV